MLRRGTAEAAMVGVATEVGVAIKPHSVPHFWVSPNGEGE